jgi:hypothetical protein
MTPETSGDSSKRVSRDIFRRIQDSFTTQGYGVEPLGPYPPETQTRPAR